MKKLIYIIFLMFFFKVNAQDSLVFKMKYLPDHKYKSVFEMHNNIALNLKGSKVEIDKLKAEGIQSPMGIVGETSTEYTIETGATTKSGIFPATIIYESIISKQFLNNKELSLPKNSLSGKKIYAHSNGNDMLSIDSISDNKDNDNLLSSVSTMFKRINKKINFPEKKIKIGESFTQEIPMTLPLIGNNATTMVKVIYKLIEIKDEQGVFDIVQSANINMNTQQGDVNITGNGTGKLIFSIKNKFPVQYETDIILNFTLNLNGTTADGSGKISADFNTEIN